MPTVNQEVREAKGDISVYFCPTLHAESPCNGRLLAMFQRFEQALNAPAQVTSTI